MQKQNRRAESLGAVCEESKGRRSGLGPGPRMKISKILRFDSSENFRPRFWELQGSVPGFPGGPKSNDITTQGRTRRRDPPAKTVQKCTLDVHSSHARAFSRYGNVGLGIKCHGQATALPSAVWELQDLPC